MTIQTNPTVRVTRERIRLNGTTIHCAVAGSGEPVVLLHGWPQTWYAWRKVIPLLASKYTVIVPDMPGFGDSAHPASGYDKKTIASTLRELIKSLGHERIRLVGHDMGGQVAYAYAAQWPQEVSHLTILECGIPGIMSEAVANPLQGGSWHYAFNMLPDLPESLVQGRERLFIRYVLFRDKVGLFDPEAISEQDLDVYEASLKHPGGLRASFEYYRALHQDALDNRAWVKSKLAVPTQTIAAAHAYGNDWLNSVRNVAQHVDAVLIPQSGHYIPEEQPALLAENLLRFFQT